jgi:phenylacetate-CoA ligase
VKLRKRIGSRLTRWQYGRIARRLRQASAAELAAASERRALEAFHRAAREVPAYGRILRRHGVEAGDIATIEDFRRRVPVIDKEGLFAANALREVCAGGGLDDVRLLFSSSGHTGVFSYGVEKWAEGCSIAAALEFAMHNAYGILDRPTILINCLPMGVRIHTRTLPLADTGVREDVACALIHKLRNDFEQFILVGEHPFLKKLIEEGAEHGIDWHGLVVHVLTGGEYVPESFRSYLAALLGSRFDSVRQGSVGINFGLSELSVSVFGETVETVQIRRAAQEDADLRAALCGRETTICPPIMQYYPTRTYVETIPGEGGRSELVVSTLDPAAKIPLIRYNTKDVAVTMSHEELARTLRQFGHESLTPPFRLPAALAWGKLEPLAADDGRGIYPEQVKEALYADFAVASAVTGNFRLEEPASPRLLVQLREGRPASEELAAALERQLRRYVEGRVDVRLLRYEQFPHGFAHDFERKNRYLPPGGTDLKAVRAPAASPRHRRARRPFRTPADTTPQAPRHGTG